MASSKLNWAPDLSFPAGYGVTWERFIAIQGKEVFEIDTTPWGDADLKINGMRIAHTQHDLRPADAFRELEAVAERIARMQFDRDSYDSTPDWIPGRCEEGYPQRRLPLIFSMPFRHDAY